MHDLQEVDCSLQRRVGDGDGMGLQLDASLTLNNKWPKMS